MFYLFYFFLTLLKVNETEGHFLSCMYLDIILELRTKSLETSLKASGTKGYSRFRFCSVLVPLFRIQPVFRT